MKAIPFSIASLNPLLVDETLVKFFKDLSPEEYEKYLDEMLHYGERLANPGKRFQEKIPVPEMSAAEDADYTLALNAFGNATHFLHRIHKHGPNVSIPFLARAYAWIYTIDELRLRHDADPLFEPIEVFAVRRETAA